MPVVGNDVVDLRHPDALKKNLDDRFVGRVFLPEEKRLIFNGSDPERTLWQLWAAKETAYKIVSKFNPAVHSGPLKYQVLLPENVSLLNHPCQITCRVETPAKTVTVAIQNEADYVHAFGYDGDQVCSGILHLKVFRLDYSCLTGRTESDAVRGTLRRHLGRFWGIPAGQIDICRDETERGAGPPAVYIQGRRASADISLSHHGRYGAFVWFAGID